MDLNLYLYISLLLVIDDTPPSKVFLLVLHFDHPTWLQERHTEHGLHNVFLHLLLQLPDLLSQLIVVCNGVLVLNNNRISLCLNLLQF